MAATPKVKRCKDCMAEDPTGVRAARRVASYPGPRCRTHHNVRKREVRLANHGRRTEARYSISPETYAFLLAHQGGVCAICRRAKGNPDGERGKRNLAVDHDHACCAGPTSCGRCVRGLVCGPCNDVLAHFRDDPDAFARGAAYLVTWPSKIAGVV